MALRILEPKTKQEMDQYYDLRWRILRRPWNQPKGSEQDGKEHGSFHVMICEEEQPVGIGRAHFNSPDEAQIRYMAVEESRRGKGVGGLILKELEHRVLKEGAKTVVLNAREEAVPFYRKHGYEIIGEAPTLFGSIRHVKMEKKLNG